jgi:uncharacterized protein with GYD domain
MFTYIFLMKLTDKGKDELKNTIKWIEGAIHSYEICCGGGLQIYPVMGEYDFVALGDAPTDRDAMNFILGLSMQGYVTIATLKAFTLDEFADMINDLRLGKTPI